MSAATTNHRVPPEMPPHGASDVLSLFPPADWYYDPISRKALPYASVRPCSCGCTQFIFATHGTGDRDHGVFCSACYNRADDRYRLKRKHDLIYANLDTRTRVVTATMPVADVLRLRARMPKS